MIPRFLPLLICLILPTKFLWADPSFDVQYGDLTQAIEAQGGAAALYLKRAKVSISHGDAQEALKDISLAEKAEGPSADGHLLRGQSLLLDENLHAALLSFEACLKIQPKSVSAWQGKARSLEGQNQWADAAQSWQQAIQHSAVPSPGPYLYLAQAQAKSGGNGPSQALQSLEAAKVALGPLYVLESFALELEMQLGKRDAALKRIDEMAGRTQRKDGLYLKRAQILEQDHALERAMAAYALALAETRQLPPSRQNTRHTLAIQDEASAALTRLSHTLSQQSKDKNP